MNDTTKAIAFIGAGNMAASIIGGLIQQGYPANLIWVSNPESPKLAALRDQFNIQTTTDNTEAAGIADIIILAVKPKIIPTVITEIAPYTQNKTPLIISVAAGIPLATFQLTFGDTYPLIRCVPNTPSFIGCGASALYASPNVSTAQRQLIETIFNAVGLSVWVDDEKQIDIATALSGSGPAYYFQIMEHFIAAATELGLPKTTATLLAKQTALGAARMACESESELATLRENVTSPGGTTAAALQSFKENQGNLQDLLTQGLKAATIRAEELARGK